jgi:hypothetical protein
MSDPRHRDMMAAQAPLTGRREPVADLLDAVRATFQAGEPVAIVDGQRWVRLPDCPGCMSYRWDKERQKFFHDRDCTVRKTVQGGD